MELSLCERHNPLSFMKFFLHHQPTEPNHSPSYKPSQWPQLAHAAKRFMQSVLARYPLIALSPILLLIAIIVFLWVRGDSSSSTAQNGQLQTITSSSIGTANDLPKGSGQSSEISDAANATTAPKPTSTPVLTADERLSLGKELLRYGNHVAARSQLAVLLVPGGSERMIRLQAQYLMTKSYLAENFYTEAKSLLNELEAELAIETTNAVGSSEPATQALQHKVQFLHGETMTGLGRYPEAIASYEKFLEAYPLLAESVVPQIAQLHILSNDVAGAIEAYRRAADATEDRVEKVRLLETLAQFFTDSSRHAEAAAAYDEILQLARNAPYRTQIAYRAGQAGIAAGDEDAAVARWQMATDEDPSNQFCLSGFDRARQP